MLSDSGKDSKLSGNTETHRPVRNPTETAARNGKDD